MRKNNKGYYKQKLKDINKLATKYNGTAWFYNEPKLTLCLYMYINIYINQTFFNGGVALTFFNLSSIKSKR